MDIEEAKKRVSKAEADITLILQKLEGDTGLSVSDIRVSALLSEIGRRGTGIGAVEVTANI